MQNQKLIDELKERMNKVNEEIMADAKLFENKYQ